MKALILNSGMGTRLRELTNEHPKCMTRIYEEETILSHQLKLLCDIGIEEVVITTGAFCKVLEDYCQSLKLPLRFTFVYNPQYKDTNYIYSIYLAKEYLRGQDILLMHGDLVFEPVVLHDIVTCLDSSMVVSTCVDLPKKDFKAVVRDGLIRKVGVEFFEAAVAAQPLYKLNKEDADLWLNSIVSFCEKGEVKCYAENALNVITEECKIKPFDIKNQICAEIDTIDDLKRVTTALDTLKDKRVYMCFSTDIIHAGHINLIKKAAKYGKLTIGILSDEAVVSYKRFPLLPASERKVLFENIVGVDNVIEQKELSYQESILKLKPDFVVHGDDWKSGIQKPIREEVIDLLAGYGGRLIEFPYRDDEQYLELEKRARKELSLPDLRRSRLKKIMEMKGFATAMEAHSGITGLLVENTKVCVEGKTYQFDAMWISSLCDSTAKGKPDIELVDMTSRYRTIDDIMEVTTKPIIFDGDTGGLIEHFVYTVKTLERMGVSMVIIEDKTGLKKNSLFGTEVEQTQEDIEKFCAKIKAGKMAQKTPDFMIVARIESLILKKGVSDALKRAFAFVEAGADGIMIHSKEKEPDEVFEFIQTFRQKDQTTPLVVVPTTYHSVTEEEFKRRGVNIVIYANQLTRSSFPAMKQTAEVILKNHRAKEADEMCMPIKEILTLIPEEY